jgi:RNA polymerase sigma-70 factor (ECF subfamily)
MQLTQAAAMEMMSQPGEQELAAIRPKLVRIALALGIDPNDADDLAQESLLSAHRNLHRFDPAKGSFESWTSVILVNRARSWQRSRQRRWKMLNAFRASARGSDAAGGSTVEARLTLRRLLAGLTPRQREVVALYEIGGSTASEAAAALGMTEAGVRSIARDARRKLSELAGRADDE